MFKSERPLNIEKEFKRLLTPFLFLDKDKEEGLACRFKFTNDYMGVSLETRRLLNTVSKNIIEERLKISAKDRISVIDTLVLYSNHLDQQKLNDNPKPEFNIKNAMVHQWLKAAFDVFNTFEMTQFDLVDTKILSSYAQTLFYYGKARRYVEAPVESRLEMLQKALEVATYLDAKHLSAELDPHQYSSRISTYELPIMYCLMDLNRYSEASRIVEKQLQRETSAFHKIHAYCKLADIYTRESKHNGVPLNPKAIESAKEAMRTSYKSGELPFLGESVLMKAYFQNQEYSQAAYFADLIIDSPAGSVKDFVIEEAKGIKEKCLFDTPKP